MLQPDNLMIGVGGIMTKTIQDEPRLNRYFRFRPETWGRGYATEMARAAVALAFGPLNRTAVWATVRADNTPSRNALERLGMSLRGSLDDVPGHGPSLRYAIQRTT